MSRNRDMDWDLIKNWIVEVSNGNINEVYQDDFVALVTRLTLDHFEDRRDQKVSEYQSDVLASMYIVGCFSCNHPFDIETLCTLCDECYTSEHIVNSIHRLICWMSPTSEKGFDRTKIEERYTVASSPGMTCDLVVFHPTNSQLIRKRIAHGSVLPAYDAMVETVVHYLLPPKPLNIARLVHVYANDIQTDLYYEYVPIPLKTFFGTHDNCILHTVLVSLLRGVRDLHMMGIAHRDLKGMNVHVADDNQCKLLDVGSAGYASMRQTVPICTISHRSPDILQAEVNDVDYLYDGKCLDMWSLGVLILELYLGSHPFGRTYRGESAKSMLSRINRAKKHVLLDIQHKCTNAQLAIITRCLDSLPENRPNIDEVMVVFEPHVR
jgi:serine/threonine protein kinase